MYILFIFSTRMAFRDLPPVSKSFCSPYFCFTSHFWGDSYGSVLYADSHVLFSILDKKIAWNTSPESKVSTPTLSNKTSHAAYCDVHYLIIGKCYSMKELFVEKMDSNNNSKSLFFLLYKNEVYLKSKVQRYNIFFNSQELKTWLGWINKSCIFAV